MESSENDRKVWVCASCLCASCWHGEFMCQKARKGNIIQKTVRELLALNIEHPDHFSLKKIKEVYGREEPERGAVVARVGCGKEK